MLLVSCNGQNPVMFRFLNMCFASAVYINNFSQVATDFQYRKIWSFGYYLVIVYYYMMIVYYYIIYIYIY